MSTHNKQFHDKKKMPKILKKINVFLKYRKNFLGTKNEFKLATINESSVFESLRFTVFFLGYIENNHCKMLVDRSFIQRRVRVYVDTTSWRVYVTLTSMQCHAVITMSHKLDATTRGLNNVTLTSLLHYDVVSTVMRHCINAMCLLALYQLVRSLAPNIIENMVSNQNGSASWQYNVTG